MGVSDRPGLTVALAAALRMGVPTPINLWRHWVSSSNFTCLLPCNGQRGSWGFYREEKTLLASVPIAESNVVPS